MLSIFTSHKKQRIPIPNHGKRIGIVGCDKVYQVWDTEVRDSTEYYLVGIYAGFWVSENDVFWKSWEVLE